LYSLMRVATLILINLSTKAERTYDARSEAKYGSIQSLQDVESKLHRDKDLETIKRMEMYV